MPNDAKLGLLAGVLGVLVAAVASVQRPTPPPGANTSPPPSAPAKPAPKPDANAEPSGLPRTPAVLPTELPSTPVVRTKKEPDATPASRARNDDDIDP
jgi:hypothetical protein